MVDLALLIQIAQLVSILGTAALLFIRLGRIYEQIERNTADAREMRHQLRDLHDAKVAAEKDTQALANRVDTLDRRVERIEAPHHPHGRIVAT